jgi:hypothetical protein
VSYTTLIRLGVLSGKGTGAFEKGMFGDGWDCHSSQYIDSLYSSLLEKLREKPFGPFDALSILIGDNNARFFCQDHLSLIARPRLT